ncbi:mismatch-specific DNA-glycosylase [Ferruginivarius sediminum]|uniref:Mismatch-specific DNA-glycosylase n=1 Tax=Ferruginivarius sediminum TaxID=2661937 RepID=A0A369TCI2_9PROT|nr:mismatch-specific DNA-glycosylase [Ferruginivarius sediminum]RDD62532.1 mismatch-specific DNA-glycosylase [Ferruginivarius sediminum]
MTILPDVLTHDLAIVFCGSAAGHVSAARGAYYAGPGNRFWPTLAEVGLTPRQLAPEEFRLLPAFGLGLTDLCQSASGPDAALPRTGDDPDALDAKIRRYRPRCLAFVGKRPAKVALGRKAIVTGALPDTPYDGTRIFVLPSPSGAARRYWDIEPWRVLARQAGR